MKEYREQEGQRPNLYHRLVGALVLIALVVIIVPMVLDFNADQIRLPSQSNIPEKPQGYRVEEVPLIAPGGGVVPVEGDTDAVASPPPGQEASPSLSDKSLAGGISAGKPPAWVVQVGSFSSQENARVLRDQLRSKGYKAVFVDREMIEGKPVLRVRIGPELERARSEQVRERLAREMNLKGVVVSYDWRSTRAE